MQVNKGEIWNCDLGFNVGAEKNKNRRVIVLSNNRVNRTGKVLVAPITDAMDKINVSNLPQQNSWYLLYSDTKDPEKMFKPNRDLPKNAIAYSWLIKDSIIQCEEMRSVSKARLSDKKGVLDPSEWEILNKKIKRVFDIT